MTEKEKRYQRKSAIITGAIQLVVLLVLIFAIAWREPDPPIPEYGIELNFGLVDAGVGDEQPEDPVEEAVVEETEPLEVQEEVVHAPVEEVIEEVQQQTEEVSDAATATEDINSPDVVEEQVDSQPEVVETPEEPVEAPPVEEPKKEVKTISYPAKEQGQGDQEEAGDQGDPEGQIDSRALYGSQGAKDGPSLSMRGWRLDEVPKPQDNSNEEGKIVFEIKVDEDGYIIGIKTLSSTVTPAVERVYQRSIENLQLVKIEEGSGTVSTGTITFIIKTK